MKVQDILSGYSDKALDQLSTDKVDEAVNLRLPRAVIIQEIASALSSLSYVARILSPTKPPAYAFIKLLLDSPDYSLPIENFREKVLSATEELILKAESGKSLSADKNYELYLKILKKAWEDDVIERNEALILEALRNELGIWTHEHLLLEHHPDVNQITDFSTAYMSVRNHLLITGLVLTYDNNYILAEEVALQTRRAWGIELENASYMRFLSIMTKEQLYNILDKTGLMKSGSKEEQIRRIINALIPPMEVLNLIHIDELRELCRNNNVQVSGTKSEVIGNIIDHFDQGRDLIKKEEQKDKTKLPEEPEVREITGTILSSLLNNLSNDQLYDVLSSCFLRTSGTKDIKIERLAGSPWSERTMLGHLRRVELSNLCRKLGIQISGVKNELVDRLIEWASATYSDATVKAVDEDLRSETETVDVSELTDIETKAKPLPGLENIKKDYPDLTPDEQIILALIKETKSLTENDIERASRRHGFEWFLTKAHMADILAKLKRTGNTPIRIRGVRSINIYEWLGSGKSGDNEVKKSTARDIIDALRQGVVPEKSLDLLAVGQEAARNHLKELLDEVHDDKSAFKFIRGPYGAGKTFLCSWLRQYALENEFVVSTINIGPDQPLSDLPVFFSGVILGLRTPEKLDSSALADVLESWLLTVHRKTAKIEGLDAFHHSTKEKLMPLVEERIESELSNISTIDPCFSSALRAFYHSRLTGDQATAANAVAWLSGSRSISGKSLNTIGVRGYLEANQVFPRMRALLEVIGGGQFRGLLLMVDELELVRKFPHTRQREQALETLRLLIDETGKNGFPGCLLIFTGTDTFFEDDRAGLKSYEALDNRVSMPINTPNGMVSMRQPVICLEGLNWERLISVALKVRDIHSDAYGWDSKKYVPDELIKQFVREWTSFGDENITRKPRPVLRELIHILDLCEENPGISVEELLGARRNRSEIARDIVDILQE